MNDLWLAGQELSLCPPVVEYAALIAGQMAVAAATIAEEGRPAARQMRHVDYWTTNRLVAWRGPTKELRDSWLNRLAGAPLLDLGCGSLEGSESFRSFVAQYRPSAYMGVDHITSYGDQPSVDVAEFGIVTPLPEADDALPGLMVHGDILEVLSRLPDNSVNIALNGVDEWLMPAGGAYGQAVTQEIIRVARPGGLVFGVTLAEGVLKALAQSHRFGVFFKNVSTPGYSAHQANGFYLLSKWP